MGFRGRGHGRGEGRIGEGCGSGWVKSGPFTIVVSKLKGLWASYHVTGEREMSNGMALKWSER